MKYWQVYWRHDKSEEIGIVWDEHTGNIAVYHIEEEANKKAIVLNKNNPGLVYTISEEVEYDGVISWRTEEADEEEYLVLMEAPKE